MEERPPPRKPYRRLRKPRTKPPNVWIGLVIVALVGVAAWLVKRGFQGSVALVEQFQPSFDEGVAFGPGKRPQACVDDALETVPNCGRDDIECFLHNHFFVRGCIESADRDAYCDVVPRMPSSQEEWMERNCQRIDHPGCAYVMGGVLIGCQIEWQP